MLRLRPMVPMDVLLLTPIMECAFDRDAEIHLGVPKGGPPGYDNGDFLRQYALHAERTALVIELDGEPIGAARVLRGFASPGPRDFNG